MQVSVRDNNVEQALRALKKKLQREGVFREMKLRQHFEKPSVKKAREKAEAVRRARKLARKSPARRRAVRRQRHWNNGLPPQPGCGGFLLAGPAPAATSAQQRLTPRARGRAASHRSARRGW